MTGRSEIRAYLWALPPNLRRRVWLCVSVIPLELTYLTVEVAADLYHALSHHTPLPLKRLSESFNEILPVEYAVLASMLLYLDTFWRMAKHYLQRSRKRMDAINASSAVARLGVDGRFLEANPVLCGMVGRTREQLIGAHHSLLVPRHVKVSGEYDDFWRALRAGEMVSGLFERISSWGSPVWLRGTYHPIRDSDGSICEILKVATDETERVEAQVKLQTANTYLEHAAKILRHDMHSGINTYLPRGISSLNRRMSRYPEAREATRPALRMLEEGLAHTQRVYQGVTAFTDLVRPKTVLKRAPCKLSEILQSYLDATAYSDQVRIGDLPVVSVNEPLFCTAIDNFIRNGLKYNDSPSKLVEVIMLDPDHVAVLDNGRGLTQDEFDLYSKPYVRKKGQKESGTGLGLNISLAILREHGFPVRCERRPGGGTKILIGVAVSS